MASAESLHAGTGWSVDPGDELREKLIRSVEEGSAWCPTYQARGGRRPAGGTRSRAPTAGTSRQIRARGRSPHAAAGIPGESPVQFGRVKTDLVASLAPVGEVKPVLVGDRARPGRVKDAGTRGITQPLVGPTRVHVLRRGLGADGPKAVAALVRTAGAVGKLRDAMDAVDAMDAMDKVRGETAIDVRTGRVTAVGGALALGCGAPKVEVVTGEDPGRIGANPVGDGPRRGVGAARGQARAGLTRVHRRRGEARVRMIATRTVATGRTRHGRGVSDPTGMG